VPQRSVAGVGASVGWQCVALHGLCFTVMTTETADNTACRQEQHLLIWVVQSMLRLCAGLAVDGWRWVGGKERGGERSSAGQLFLTLRVLPAECRLQFLGYQLPLCLGCGPGTRARTQLQWYSSSGSDQGACALERPDSGTDMCGCRCLVTCVESWHWNRTVLCAHALCGENTAAACVHSSSTKT
jgi:hypothetical protein